MLSKSSSLVGFLLLLLVAVSVQAQKVSVGFDRAADFSKFKTYTWAKGSPAKNPAIDQEIIAAIEQQLTLKGLTRTTGSSDVSISYSAAVMTGFDEATVAKPGTWGPRAGSGNQVWQIKKGALLITMKGVNNEELWRATATDTLSQDANADVTKDMDKARKKVRQAVEKMFKYYPPK
ncbi:MAG TPA: DUF4136 domain-containing protein [Pyrinomonadaceae bacterium]|nr:DUF4136 domain-containing protein [Pyrinomonadaceae bacterium]